MADVARAEAAVRHRARAVATLAAMEILLAVAAFTVLCFAALWPSPVLVEPDDYAYQASIVAATDGHWLALTGGQVNALTTQLAHIGDGGPGTGLGIPGGQTVPAQWVRLPSGRWMSEKDPGYPYLAAPFQELGIIRLAPLFYAALGCLGLYAGGRRWLGRFGGAAAVGLYCSSGAAMLFAWRDYMPTFTDASLIAAGVGALLWAVLARGASRARRTWAGLAGFVALEAATFTRYTDVVALGCAVLAVLVARRRRCVPWSSVAWWLGSVAVFGAGVAVFDDLVYGGPLRSGYRPGEIQFSLSALGPNFRYMPAHLIESMPFLVLGILSLAGIVAQWLARRRVLGGERIVARRDLAVGLALAACWAGLWGLYATYTWTAAPGLLTLQSVRFYVPALGAMSLLAAWPLVRLPPRARLAGLVTTAVVAVAFGFGIWNYNSIRPSSLASFMHRPPGMAHIGRPGPGAPGGPAPPGPVRQPAG